MGSVLAGETVSTPLAVCPPPSCTLPYLSTPRYERVPVESVTLKISTVPPVACLTISPVADVEVGVMVWVLPGSSTRQLVHSPPLPPVTDPQDGRLDPDTSITCPGDPIPSAENVLAAEPYGRSPEVSEESPVPPWLTPRTLVTSELARSTADDDSTPDPSVWSSPEVREEKVIWPEEVRPVAPVIEPALVIPPDETFNAERVVDPALSVEEKDPVPMTSRFLVGVLVPIPTLSVRVVR